MVPMSCEESISIDDSGLGRMRRGRRLDLDLDLMVVVRGPCVCKGGEGHHAYILLLISLSRLAHSTFSSHNHLPLPKDHLYSHASFDPFWDYDPPADVGDDDSDDYIDFSEESYPVPADVGDDDSEFVGESSHRRPAIRKPDISTVINRLMKLVLDREDDARLVRRVAEAEAEDARRRVEEAEAAAAAEVARKKLEEDQEMERQIAIKDTNLPPEPASDDEGALNIKVYMPDGSLRRRRFLRTHSLQATLFPWRGYNDHDLALTLNEVVTGQVQTFYVKASKW
ncbi:hypothetical protein ACE6H2_017214 [Prunus campanulata]